MKTHLYLLNLFWFTPTYPAIVSQCNNPGCIRKNSDGLLRDLLFMHLENGQMPLVISLLDTETIELTSISGQSIQNALEMAGERYKTNIEPVLQKIAQLQKEKREQTPIADLPD